MDDSCETETLNPDLLLGSDVLLSLLNSMGRTSGRWNSFHGMIVMGGISTVSSGADLVATAKRPMRYGVWMIRNLGHELASFFVLASYMTRMGILLRIL